MRGKDEGQETKEKTDTEPLRTEEEKGSKRQKTIRSVVVLFTLTKRPYSQ